MTGLLVVIYIAFIGLGLPDSLWGTAWPVIREEIGAPLSSAGIVSMIVSFGTVISSLSCSAVVRKFGTGRVTALSVLLTALALLGYAVAPSLLWLCVFAVPLGLGAGAVDAALNNYVALHYSARHMNFLHFFWGVGATIGPVVMGYFIKKTNGTGTGYWVISIALFAIALLLILSLSKWVRPAKKPEEKKESSAHELFSVLQKRGFKAAITTFFCYCGAESAVGLWAASFLVEYRGVEAATAALWVSLYYGGITLGRLLSGILSGKMSPQKLIFTGLMVSLAGIVMLLLPFGNYFSLAALLLIGLGFAPVYPNMIHETPKHFGEASSQAAIGLQMATAYAGTTLVPPAVGLLAGSMSMLVLPFCVMALIAGMIACELRIKHLFK